MEQDEEGPSMSSKEENIENLPFFGEAHRESASLFLFLLVMDTYGYTPVVPACSRNEQRRIAGERALSLSTNKKLITESSRRKETAPADPFLIPSIFPHWSDRSSFFSRPNIGSFSPNSMPIPFHPGLIMWLLVPFPRTECKLFHDELPHPGS